MYDLLLNERNELLKEVERLKEELRFQIEARSKMADKMADLQHDKSKLKKQLNAAKELIEVLQSYIGTA